MLQPKWTPLLAICLGTFMLMLDVTIINVALPEMVASLDASFTSLQWVMNGYSLALASLLLGVGTLADLVGRRRVFLVGLTVFALASLACGLAPTPGALIAARVVQGIGAAGMFATNVALISGIYSGRDRGIAFGTWAAVVSTATALGPLAGGVLTDLLSWRWIFFVNLPIALVAIVLVLRVVKETSRPEGGRLDVAGIAAFTTFAGVAVFALVRVSDVGWGATSTFVLLGIAIAALVAFLLIERTVRAPLLDLGLLRHGAFNGVLVGGVVLSVSAFCGLVYASLWMQDALGLDPLVAGLVLLPLSIASFSVALAAGRWIHGAAVRWSIGIGLLVIGAGNLLQSGLNDGSSWPALIAGLTVIGIGVGLTSPSLVATAMASVPPAHSGMAAGAVNTGRQLGLAVGVAVLGSVFDARTATDGAAAGLGATFLIAGVIGLIGGAITLVLVRPASPPA